MPGRPPVSCRKTIALGTAALLAWIVAGPPAEAAPRYVVGVEDIDYLPAYTAANGQWNGVSRQILDAFAKDQGIEFSYLPLPIVRLTREFIDGRIDLHFPDNPRWNTDLKANIHVIYSAPVINYIDGTLVLPSRAGQGPGAIKIIGTAVGSPPSAWEELLKGGKVKQLTNPNFMLLMRMATLAHVDGAYASIAVANYQLDHVLHQPGALVFDRTLPYEHSAYTLSTLRHPELVAAFNAWLVSHRAWVDDLKRQSGVEQGILSP